MVMDEKAKKSIKMVAIILAVGLSIAFVFILAVWQKVSASKDASGESKVPTVAKDVQKKSEGEPTANYADMSRSQDLLQANNAQQSGQSFMPQFSPPAETINDPTKQQNNQGDQSTPTGQQKSAQQPLTAQQQQEIDIEKEIESKNEAEMASKRKMVEQLKAPFVAEGYSSFDVVSYRTKDSEKTSNDKTPANDSSTKTKSEMFIKSGEKAFISIETAIDTDEPSPILGQILTGPASGLTVIGKATHNPDDTISIAFDQLNMKDGTSMKIEAFAIDPETGRTAVAGAVNHKIFERFVLPAIAGGMAAYGQDMQQAGMQQIMSPLAGTTMTTYVLSPAQIAEAAAASGVGTLSNNLNAVAAKAQPEVTTKSNLGLQIIFMKEVVIQKKKE